MDSFDIFLYIAYVLVIIAVVSALALPLIGAFSNPKGFVKSGLALLALVVLFLVAYGISGNEVTPLYTRFEIGPDRSKLIGGGLIMVYVMLFGSFLGILWTETHKIFK
jgi:hypothetical protein